MFLHVFILIEEWFLSFYLDFYPKEHDQNEFGEIYLLNCISFHVIKLRSAYSVFT